jgi:hypothetical protein
MRGFSFQILFLVMGLQFSQGVFARSRTEWVEGSGQSMGFCRGDAFSRLCVMDLEQKAERDTELDADWRCQNLRGALQRFSPSCSTWCNPSWIQPDTDAFVSCRATCRYNCEIRE